MTGIALHKGYPVEEGYPIQKMNFQLRSHSLSSKNMQPPYKNERKPSQMWTCALKYHPIKNHHLYMYIFFCFGIYSLSFISNRASFNGGQTSVHGVIHLNNPRHRNLVWLTQCSELDFILQLWKNQRILNILVVVKIILITCCLSQGCVIQLQGMYIWRRVPQLFELHTFFIDIHDFILIRDIYMILVDSKGLWFIDQWRIEGKTIVPIKIAMHDCIIARVDEI